MEIQNGSSRMVLLIGQLAIKIPRINNGFDMFMRGIIGNFHEERVWKHHIQFHWKLQFAPVLFGFFGLITVMKRAKPFNGHIPENWHKVHYSGWAVEYKNASFGILDNKIVAIDYGIAI